MSLSREVFRHASIYSLAAFLGKAIGFLMLPFYAAIFHTTGYGIVGMIDASINLLLSLFGYGSLTRFYHEQADSSQKRLVISTGVRIYWIGGLTAVSITALFATPLSQLLFGDAAQANFLRLSLFTFLLDLTGQAANTYFIINQRSALVSALGIFRLLLALTLNIVLILVLRWGLLGYFVSAFTTSLVVSLTVQTLVLRECGLGFNWPLARQMLKFELPLVPGNLVSFASRQIERVLVRFQSSLDSVGILEMAYRFPPLIGLFVVDPFMASWGTKRTQIAAQPGAPAEMGRVLTQYAFLLLFVALLLGANMPVLLQMLTPPQFWPAARVARVEIVTMLVTACYYQLYFGLFYTKNTKTISLIRGVTSVVKIAMSYWFIRTWGLAGAAYSALAAALVQTIWAGTAGQRAYRIEIQYGRILILIASAATLDLLVAELDLVNSRFIAAVYATLIAPTVAWLEASPVGQWHGGAFLRGLDTRAPLLFVMLAQTAVCGLFLLTFPLANRRGASLGAALRPSRSAESIDQLDV